MQMEAFQKRQNIKVRKQEAIKQLLLFLFFVVGGAIWTKFLLLEFLCFSYRSWFIFYHDHIVYTTKDRKSVV